MNLAGVDAIPASYIQRAKRNYWPNLVAYKFKLDPGVVKQWDNDSILDALAALKVMGAIK